MTNGFIYLDDLIDCAIHLKYGKKSWVNSEESLLFYL